MLRELSVSKIDRMFKLFTKALSGKLKSLIFEEMANDEDISWYHGNLSRDDVEEVFQNASFSMGQSSVHGLFLVRDSSTSAGDFVLSVMNKTELLHFQIRRHGEDAFFSINEQTIFHGLETLIEYYKEDGHGLPCVLGNPIRKDPPPPDTRRHGRTNLLHRATKEGNFTVVSELLRCGYRNIEAKNQDGQTAVHLACKLDKESILEKLIESGANVNSRDQQGNTPLHYACQNNFVKIVKILLSSGGANVQIRNTNTGWVPLHEAAHRGHKEIVEHLLRVAAPSRPRTMDFKTPQMLAEENGYYQVSYLLKVHEGPKPKTTRDDWFHGTLTRNEAVELLKASAGNPDGRFLVRYSEKHHDYILTMMSLTESFHYVIKKEGTFYFIDNGPLLDSLEHVIEHYSTMPDGLPTILQVPVKPRPKPPLPNYHPSSLFSTLPVRGKKSRLSEGNIANTATMPLPPKTKPRKSIDNSIINQRPPLETISCQICISSESLIMKEVIGEGEFGSVFKAIYQTRGGAEVEVAVKTMHSDHLISNRDTFLKEAEVMMKLNHHCIVRLIGVSENSNESLMIQELIPLGSMLTFITVHRDQVNMDYELPVWSSQIACGMEYLVKNRIVHRDLAARNILLATRHQAKISDFGLSRNISDNKDYYKATKGGRWPIKWYAPESYNYGTFSSASDVWSFGVTLWEMYSYGQTPFGEMRGSDVIREIDKGNRLDQPDDCPVEVYQMMERCWEYNSRNRPTFSELYDFFSALTNYENVRDLVPKTDIS